MFDKNLIRNSKFDAALSSIAVMRYRADNHGELPDSLDVLVPEYLKSVPIHPTSAGPFTITKTERGFTIGVGASEFTVILHRTQ